MKKLAKHPYYKIERQVSSIEQMDVEEERFIILYEDKISSHFHEFLIKKVLDISYRMISENVGFLYLHTTKGVYSYQIKNSPEKFVKAFHDHIEKW